MITWINVVALTCRLCVWLSKTLTLWLIYLLIRIEIIELIDMKLIGKFNFFIDDWWF